SLVRAAQAVTDAGAHDPGAGAVFASLRGGLGRLPTALAASGGFAVRVSTTVRAVRRTAGGFEVLCGPVPGQEAIAADAVVLATPAAKTALLLGEIAPAASGGLNSIDSASVAIVTLAFDDAHPPAGSGLLIALQEGFTTKAVTLTSQKWPIDTGGVTVLRASLGRAGDAQALQRDDVELIALVRHELRSLIGVAAEPIDALVTRWGGGLPQYAVGHVALVGRIRAAVAVIPALAVCGAAYDGVGVPACIASAYAAADRVVAALAAGGQSQS
ncbi:MAG: FAD-dependent oxidoreductase, partial [Actinomycetota bacterium]|nr:FAD-dependent oxidoreductase [Actinomycetota bacterium]